MFARLIRVLVTLGLVAFGFTACDRSQPSAPSSRSFPSSNTVPAVRGEVSASAKANDISTVHWLGKKRLAADTNAAAVMAIWNLRESANLGAQTLDKLALAPWRLLKNDAATNGAPVALLRPLLNDLVTEESHLIIHHPTNAPAAWSLAIRLPSARSQLWQTNLAAILESLTGAKSEKTADGFIVTYSNYVFGLSRTNDWTVLNVSPSSPSRSGRGLGELSILQAAVLATSSTNWLSLSLDPTALNRAFNFGWSLPVNCPRVAFTLHSDGQNVRTRGELDFRHPLNLTLEPWNIPTNLIHEPLISFAAIRGVNGWLDSSPLMRQIGISRSPNQACFWALSSMPQLSYFAFPQSQSDLVERLSDYLVQHGNRWFSGNAMGRFQRSSSSNGVELIDSPFLAPFLRSSDGSGGDFVFGGLFPIAAEDLSPFPRELLPALASPTNTMAYGWEITGARLQSLTYLGQLSRLVFDKPQLPAESGIPWLRAVAPRSGNCVTRATIESAHRIVLTRNSSLGLTALESQLLIEWLESPVFPRGLYSLDRSPLDSAAAPQPAPR